MTRDEARKMYGEFPLFGFDELTDEENIDYYMERENAFENWLFDGKNSNAYELLR